MTHIEQIAKTYQLQPRHVQAVVELLDEGNTIPFIARYRKERTGTMDEEFIRSVAESIERLRTLDERREVVLNSIREQEKLTPALEAQIHAAKTMTQLEDLYRPYRPKRRTRASIAREKGLQGLADIILAQPTAKVAIEIMVKPFLNDDVPDVESALAGARDIVAETISDHAGVRELLREKAMEFGEIISEKKSDAEDERKVFEMYYDDAWRVDRIRPHQVLALNRGESEKVLKVKVTVPERDWQEAVETYFMGDRRSPLFEQFTLAVSDAADRLLLPAIERDVRGTLTATAEEHAIHVFAENLRALLNQPPIAGQVILAIDPGFRTGSKVTVIDPTGSVLYTETIYPHPPQNKRNESLKALALMVKQYNVTLIAIGNGTASRETEALVAEVCGLFKHVKYLIVSEAGASVYSASKLAKEELPGMDVSMRGAVSIGRRVQDPLAELVKIDPKAIGVGMYQHDVNQQALGASLGAVVESVVNQVGVNVNTASPALLTYVAGIGPTLAERVYAHREEQGPFRSRKELMAVKGLGAKAFEQCAGFLRIRGGEEPLDGSAIHPESYAVARKVIRESGVDLRASAEQRKAALDAFTRGKKLADLAQHFECGEPTLADILEQLVKPGRDPREDLPAPILRSDVLSMDDLTDGLVLKGTVRNVVDFGAFVDLGVKTDGLLHRSQIPRGVSLKVGDVIQVEILQVEKERKRISLAWGG
ncbi:MAG: RNA-binding transcriptional accessory protein [Anaerolineae bacterium]|nr:RNA-binding transcriptional accessory protein [Anaerolineae bacterium]